MSVDRYCFLDINFFHKRTCEKLADTLGPWAVIAFLSLIAETKRSRIKGVLVVASEPDFWQQLGLYGRDLGFDMDAFLTATGRLKQTSRRRVGRLTHVVLTNYERWQKDADTWNERERKRRKRGESQPDNDWTTPGTLAGQQADRDSRELEEKHPLPPLIEETDNGNGLPPRARFYTNLAEVAAREHKTDDEFRTWLQNHIASPGLGVAPLTDDEVEALVAYAGRVRAPASNGRFWGRLTVYATLVEQTLDSGDEQNLRASLTAGGGLSADEVERLVAYRRELVAAAQSSEAG